MINLIWAALYFFSAWKIFTHGTHQNYYIVGVFIAVWLEWLSLCLQHEQVEKLKKEIKEKDATIKQLSKKEK